MLNLNMFNRWIKLKTDKSCLIIGPRRSGKTTLLKNRYPEYNYITLDDLDYLDWAKRDPKGLVESLGEKALIDEIQRHPPLTIAVKNVIDNHGAHVLMTGSSSIGLTDLAADTLAGRINLYSLPTLCFGEEKGAPNHSIFSEELNPIELKKAAREMNDALIYGQFPEVLACNSHEDKKELLLNYRDTYFIRDLMRLSNIENMDGLFAVFQHLVRSLGSHLVVSNFSREAGLSFPTTKKYLNILRQSQLTFNLYGYQYGPAKRYIKAAKTYFADNGIITSMNIPVNEGQLFENFVIAELEKRRKLDLIKSDQFFYYKSIAGKEIDLIFESENELYAIEIKAIKNPSYRNVRSLMDFKNQSPLDVNTFLFYNGDTYGKIDDVKLIPICALWSGF